MKKSPLLVLFLTIFIDLLGFGLVIPILPNLVAKDFGQGEIVVGVVAALYSVAQFLFAPFWGTLSDRIGRRPVILGSVFMTAVSYLLFSAANSYHLFIVLLVSRFLSGFGSANISTANAYIADITLPQDRAKRMGLVGAAFGLGFIFGPPVGGWLKENYNVEMVGYAAAALSFVNFIWAYFQLPESLKTFNKDRPFKFAPLREFKGVFGKGIITQLISLNFIYITAFSMMQITAALLWYDHFGLNDAQIGYTFAFIGVCSALVQGTLVGPLNKKFGERKLMIYGMVLMAIGLFSMPFVPVEYFIPGQLISIAFIALANGMIMPSVLALLSKSTDNSQQGYVLGMNQSIGSLGRVFGPLLGGALYQLLYTLPYVGGAVLCLLSIALIFKLKIER